MIDMGIVRIGVNVSVPRPSVDAPSQSVCTLTRSSGEARRGDQV